MSGGADNGVEARFCSRCGTNLGATPEPTPAARPAADAERKQVTVLFSELLARWLTMSLE